MRTIKVFLASSNRFSFNKNTDASNKLKRIIGAIEYILGSFNRLKYNSINKINSKLKKAASKDELIKIINDHKPLLGSLYDLFNEILIRNDVVTAKNQLSSLFSLIDIKKQYNVEIDLWFEKNFKKAGYFQEELLDIPKSYDIGIFVMGEDLVKSDDDKDLIINHNVLIELGMFMVLNKPKYILRESAYKPSDVEGLKTVELETPFEAVLGFVKTIDDFYDSPMKYNQLDYSQARLFFDPSLSNNIVSFHGRDRFNEFKGLETKALFIGTKGAFCWEKIESNNNYEGNYIDEFFSNHLTWNKGSKKTTNFKELAIDNVLSFGPGIGKIDLKVLDYLQNDCLYIPIDINVSLAIKSRDRIKGAGRYVPFAVIDDFETVECYNRLNDLINNICKSEIGHKNLFMMLGVTFSNLTMKCSVFFNQMNSIMDVDDYLLLDVIIYSEGDFSPSGNIINELKKKIKKDSYWALISNGINKKRLSTVSNINKRYIKCEVLKDPSSYTIVKETKVIQVKYSNDNNVLLIGKYYNFEELSNYIKSQGFEIVVSAKYEKHKRGIFLLKKNNIKFKI